jgi:hypothetical protein
MGPLKQLYSSHEQGTVRMNPQLRAPCAWGFLQEKVTKYFSVNLCENTEITV